MPAKRLRETDLYPPVKSFFETLGYTVKGEIGAADVVACRDDEPPVIIELKTGFSLSLFHQAIERLSVCDNVYIAVPKARGRAHLRAVKNNKTLCRRLGLGLITVTRSTGRVEIHCDPAHYQPRKSKVKTARLMLEFTRRSGDPNRGGATRKGLMTTYRQDALRCAKVLHRNGPTKAALVARAANVEKARRLMADNHYGWFERVATGVYALSPAGVASIKEFKKHLTKLPVDDVPQLASEPVSKVA